jgi:hypothetical protein
MPSRRPSERRSSLNGTARRRRAREGNVAILTTLLLTVIMAFVALSFDVGNLYHVRTEVQSGVDAAALAGAAALDGTPGGMVRASDLAIHFGALQHVYKGSMAAGAINVSFGSWDFTMHKLMPPPADRSLVNAVKVEYTEPSVSLPFAAALGKASLPVYTSAVAVGGGPIDNGCSFPMVLPDCAVQAAAANDTCSACLRMGPANADNIAWTSFDNSNGLQAIADVVSSACFENGVPAINADGQCERECCADDACGTRSTVNEGVKLNNGNFFNNNGPCGLIVQLINRDGAQNPKKFTVKVPVLKTNGGGSCGAAKLSGNGNEVSGFTLVDIYGVSCGQGANALHADAPMPNPPDCGQPPPPANRYLIASLHRNAANNGCDDQPSHEHAGGGFFGVRGEPRLVE